MSDEDVEFKSVGDVKLALVCLFFVSFIFGVMFVRVSEICAI